MSGMAAVAISMATGAMAADDPYLWLEDRTGDRALAWITEQNARTAAELQTDPRYTPYVDTVFEHFSASDNVAYGYVEGGFVYNYWQDGDHNLGIWRRTSPASYKTEKPDWETVIDFDALAAEEGTKWVYSGADCLAPDFARCLVTLSPDGGDASVVREFDLLSKSFVKDGFFSPVSKSDVSWVDVDTLILAPAFTEDEQTSSGYPRVVKLWKRGTPISEAQPLLEARPDDLSAFGYVASDGLFKDLIVGRSINFYSSQQFVQAEDGALTQIPLPNDAIIQQHFDGQLVFSLRTPWQAQDGMTYAAGGLYSFDMQKWLASGEMGQIETLVAPSARTAVLSTARTKTRFYVSMLDNVRGRIVVFDRSAGQWTASTIALPDNGDVTISHSDVYGSSISFGYTDFLTPASLIWSDDDGATLKTIKSEVARFDAEPYMAEQFEAKSKDGTQIPYFVVRRKDHSGPVPTLLYGYGGFESSMTPSYSGTRGNLWLGKGNAWVLANIRGGGEFGPQWHQAAIKENRQRAYDDFAAVAEDLARRGVTTAKQLGIVGGSNGGLLTGVLLTQRPELFGAVISEVPLLDMLRYTLLPAGASWIAEYGDPAIPEEAAYIAKYSPYQNVRADVAYPPVLFLTSTADDRVHPGHARKMAALMQEAGHDALFFEETQGGHGGNGDLRRQAAFFATEYLFLQRELEGADRKPMSASEPPAAEREIELDASEPPALDCGELDAMKQTSASAISVTPSQRTRHTELVRLCARVGYSPPASP